MNEHIVDNTDINRHLPELDRKRPLPRSVPREPLDYMNRKTAESQLATLLAALETNPKIDPHQRKFLGEDMREHMSAMLNDRDNYDGRAFDLDASVAPNVFVGWFRTALIFVLDTLAFTFSFYTVLDSIYAKDQIRPEPIQLIPIAFVPAVGAAVGVKLASKHAPEKKSWLVIYSTVWCLFAVADLSYLYRMGMVLTGVAMTGLLILMSFVTYIHAAKAHRGKPRKQLLESYAEAYRRYQLKLHQWKHAVTRLRNRPEKGLDDILNSTYFEFPQHLGEPEDVDCQGPECQDGDAG